MKQHNTNINTKERRRENQEKEVFCVSISCPEEIYMASEVLHFSHNFCPGARKEDEGGTYIDCNFLAESCVVSDLSVIPNKDEQLFIMENNELVLLENINSEIIVKENGIMKVVFIPL